MHQIYFLSILSNIVAGIALGYDRMQAPLKLDAMFNADFFRQAAVRLSVGLVTFVVGFLKLLSVTPGDVAVVGDLLPAAVGLLMGFALVFEYYQARVAVRSSTIESIQGMVERFGAALGTAGIVVAVVHFFLFRVLFL